MLANPRGHALAIQNRSDIKRMQTVYQDGVGYTDPRGNKEEVAWKDFCEDLLSAHEHIRPGTPDFEMVDEARGKGQIPGKGELPQVVMGWQPGQK